MAAPSIDTPPARQASPSTPEPSRFGVASRSLDSRRKRLGLMRRYLLIGSRDECIAFIAKEFKKQKLHALFDDLNIFHISCGNGKDAQVPWTTREVLDFLDAQKLARKPKRPKLQPSDADDEKRGEQHAASKTLMQDL